METEFGKNSAARFVANLPDPEALVFEPVGVDLAQSVEMLRKLAIVQVGSGDEGFVVTPDIAMLLKQVLPEFEAGTG